MKAAMSSYEEGLARWATAAELALRRWAGGLRAGPLV